MQKVTDSNENEPVKCDLEIEPDQIKYISDINNLDVYRIFKRKVNYV